MKFFQSNYLKINYYEADKLIETCWLHYASSDEYRLGLKAYLEAIKEFDVKRWLGDYRLARVIRLEDQEWIKNEWAPLFFPHTTGIQKMAKVNAEDIFNQISSEKIRRELEVKSLPFPFQEFVNYEEAKAWVLS